VQFEIIPSQAKWLRHERKRSEEPSTSYISSKRFTHGWFRFISFDKRQSAQFVSRLGSDVESSRLQSEHRIFISQRRSERTARRGPTPAPRAAPPLASLERTAAGLAEPSIDTTRATSLTAYPAARPAIFTRGLRTSALHGKFTGLAAVVRALWLLLLLRAATARTSTARVVAALRRPTAGTARSAQTTAAESPQNGSPPSGRFALAHCRVLAIM
jgi:hypothetical protein